MAQGKELSASTARTATQMVARLTALPLTKAARRTLFADLLEPLGRALSTTFRELVQDGKSYMRQVSVLPPAAIERRTVCLPALRSYRRALTEALTAQEGDGKRRRDVIAELFSTLQSDNLGEETAAIRFKFWGELIADRPALEIELAAEYWCKNEFPSIGGNRAFAPRPAELFQMADKAREVLQAEISTIDRILAAEVDDGAQGIAKPQKPGQDGDSASGRSETAGNDETAPAGIYGVLPNLQ